MQTNPQIEVEFSVINPDGTESDMNIKLWEDMNGISYFDTKHSPEWRPLEVNASIIKTLGGAPDQSAITLHNLPWIELFRRDPVAELAKFRDESWRVRIWAWHDDNGSTSQSNKPNIPPVFVGDITEDFGIQSGDTIDSALQVQATAYGWLVNSGKMRETWQAGTTYKQIFNDILQFIISKGYGRETRTATPRYVIKNDSRMNKTLKRKFNVNRNPVEILNDLTRDIDATWGIHNNIPYVIMRDSYFGSVNGEEYPTQTGLTDDYYVLNYESGLSSLINYSKHEFSINAKFSNQLLIGQAVAVDESPQTSGGLLGVGTGLLFGRFNEINHQLNNYGDGHQSSITLSYLSGDDVVLPAQRADNSGLNSE